MRKNNRLRSLPTLVMTMLALHMVVMVAAPTPAQAVTPVHFATVTGQLVVPTNTEQHWKGYCPGGYTPASGGFTNPSLGVWRAYDYATGADDSWEFAFINGDGVNRTIDLKILCVLKADVGAISSTLVELTRNSTTGNAGGVGTCPGGQRLLSAGVDWSGGGDRKILQAYPLDLYRFQASGYSATVGAKLAIEVRCISTDIGAVHDWSSGWTASNSSITTPQTVERVCPAGMRVLLGGVRLNGAVGDIYSSNPTGRSWTATVVHSSGYMGVDAICVPGSTPVVTVTQPASPTNDTSPTLRFGASEPLGEALAFSCQIDGGPVSPCSPETDLSYSGVTAQGLHTYRVTATNSWTSSSDEKSWWLDSVAPSITAMTPATEGLTTDPVTITFSEYVTNVTTIGIAPTAGGSAAPYTVGMTYNGSAMTATLQPNSPLASGQTYTVTVPTGLADGAGNPLPPTSWDFRAVEHEPPTVVSKTSTLLLAGPVTATFSELVGGISGGSFYLRADGTASNIAATVTTAASGGKTTATLRPTAALVPGRWYTASLTNAIQDGSGNVLSALSWRMRAPTTIQNDSPALVKHWDVDSSSLASGGKFIASRTSGNAVSRVFIATSGQVGSLYGIRLPTGGSAEVWLDGVKRATVSTKATTATRVKLYATPPLAAGSHTLVVKVASGWAGIDSFTVGSTTYQESAFTQSFRRVAAASAAGGSYELVEHVKDADARPSYSMSFWGAGIKLFVTKTSASGQAYVYVDGALVSTVSLYSATTAYKQLVLSRSLPAGAHTITVAPVGTATGARSAVGVDYVAVS